MPVDFLSPAQRARYVCYAQEPSEADQARCFYLDDADHTFIGTRRGEHTQLGLALQLTTLRYLGGFLDDPTHVPAGVTRFVAQQLGLTSIPDLEPYRAGSMRRQHAAELRAAYGYHSYGTTPHHLGFLRWLYARAWIGTERPSVLFDHAMGWLLAHKVTLPGITTLERDVARVRDRANLRLWTLLTRVIPPQQATQLEALLTHAPNERMSQLEHLRQTPVVPSSTGVVAACTRLTAIRALDVGSIVLDHLPFSRVQALGRYALTAKAQTLGTLAPERRAATLLAGIRLLEMQAHDTVLDLWDAFFTELRSAAQRAGTTKRLRTLADLDAAALQLAVIAALVLDETIADADLRRAMLAKCSPETLQAAVEQVQILARPSDDTFYDELLARYRRISLVRPTLLATITFAALPAAASIRDGYQFLQQIEGQRRPKIDRAPQAVVGRVWQRYVRTTSGGIDQMAYTYCVFDRLTDALRRREVFVTPSIRYADPRKGMLEGKAWDTIRPQVCRAFNHSADGRTAVTQLADELDTSYRTVAAALPHNSAVTLETRPDGTADLSISPLEKLEEPVSLGRLRRLVDAMVPQGDLPDVLLELHRRTRFLDAFTHISEASARAKDIHISLCAVLIAEACNIGLAPLVDPTNKALTRDRLTWIQQNYIRPDTLQQANAQLVAEQSRIWLAQQWGGGEVASADGLRFVVPVRTVYAGPNAKMFGKGARGITLYNLTSNQFTGLHGMVVTGTLRDSLVLLSLILGQQTTLNPSEIMTDTGAYSDVIFGLLWLLGYQFSPRLSDVGGARFWRIDRAADYGALNGLARHAVNTAVIEAHWDELLRLVGSLTYGTVHVDSVVRTLQQDGSPTKIARALQELGRVTKTLYLLRYMHDESYRRRILTQLNRGEGRHQLARVVYYGQRGEMRQRYREGQEDQLTALGLVVNAMVLWNTIYMDRAVAQLQADGENVRTEDVARLSPLGYDHLNVLGRYSFTLPVALQQGAWRDLRRPEQTQENSENR